MSRIQDVYNRLQESKRKQKEIKEAYKNELDNSVAYQNILDELDNFKAKKKAIEDDVKSSMGGNWDKLEKVKADIQDDNQLLADLSINKMMTGQNVEIEDERGDKFYPEFSVKFKKLK